MRLRGSKKCNDENIPTPSAQHAHEAKGKTVQARQRRSPASVGSGAEVLEGGRQAVLREKTNLEPAEWTGPVRGKGKRGREVSNGAKRSLGKEPCGAELGVKGTPKRRSSFKTPPKQVGSGRGNEKDGAVIGRRNCIYMNATTSENCDPAVSGKESVYEFEVDGSEPPSRRRRRKRAPRNNNNRKRVFPRLPRVRFPSRSETTTSSVESVTTLSSFGWGSTTDLVASEQRMLSSAVVASETESKCAPPVAATPKLNARPRKRLSTVLESPPDSTATTPTPALPFVEALEVVDVHEDAVSPVGVVVAACSESTPSKIPKTAPSALHGSCHLNEDPSFSISLLSPGNESFSLGFANHHSTPVKARSTSDLSSTFIQSQADATAEKCFGFSSDEDEAEVDGLPSPLRASPQTQALRQSFLLSSPSKLAPSRFAPEVVRRALVLEAVSHPNHCPAQGVHPNGQHHSKLAGREGKRRRVGGKQRAKESLGDKQIQRIDDYLLKRDEVHVEKVKDEGDPAIVATPPAGSLFGDAREAEKEEPMPLQQRPPRRSYERPWNHKLKKVIGGGLCLDSSDEEEEGGKEEPQPQEQKSPRPQKQRKVVARQRTKAENKENQMDQWASQINSQFNEVEDFELCLG